MISKSDEDLVGIPCQLTMSMVEGGGGVRAGGGTRRWCCCLYFESGGGGGARPFVEILWDMLMASERDPGAKKSRAERSPCPGLSCRGRDGLKQAVFVTEPFLS